MSRIGSCIRIRWLSAVNGQRSALPFLAACLIDFFVTQAALASNALPEWSLFSLVLGVAVGGLLLGAAVGLGQSVRVAPLLGMGLEPARAWALVIVSSIASPLSMAVLIPFVAWYLPMGTVPALVLGSSTLIVGCATFEVGARLAERTGQDRRAGNALAHLKIVRSADSVRAESAAWGFATFVSGAPQRWMIAEALGYGALCALSTTIIDVRPSTVALSTVFVSCQFLGLATHNLFGLHGPAFWIDVAHGSEYPWKLLGAALLPLICGVIVIGASAAIDHNSALSTVGIGALTLGAAIGIGHMFAILAPYRIARAHPCERPPSRGSRILAIQALLLVLTACGPLALFVLAPNPATILVAGSLVGVAVMVVGTFGAGALAARRGARVLEYLLGSR